MPIPILLKKNTNKQIVILIIVSLPSFYIVSTHHAPLIQATELVLMYVH